MADDEKLMSGEDSNAFADPASPSKSQQSSDESASSDGVLVELPGNADQDSRVLRGDPDSGILVNFDGSMDDAGREETFEDASDEIAVVGDRSSGLEESMAMIEIGETTGGKLVSEDFARMTMRLEDTMAECRKYKEEREAFGREAVNLKEQLRDIIRWQSMSLSGNNESHYEVDDEVPTPLHSLLKDCSRFVVDLKGILNQRSYAENRMAELDAALHAKDKEIAELNLKVSESSSSLQHVELEALKQSTDDAITRLLVSLETVAGEESTSVEDSHGMIILEKKVSSLIAKHAQHQETIKKFEEENNKLTEQLETITMNLELANAEASKSKLDLQQAENKLVAAKEKLSLAVTKGKSLVQHRDSLKQSLAEKTSELERCMHELHQKSEVSQAMESSLEELKQALSAKTSELEICNQQLQQKSDVSQAMESSVEELKHILSEKTSELEKCVEELQHKTDALEAAKVTANELSISESLVSSLKESLSSKEMVLHQMESSVDELKQALSEKTKELEMCIEELQHKTVALEAAKVTADELTVSKTLVSSLKELLSSKETVLHQMEEVISQVKTPENMGPLELVEKISWLVNQKNVADAIILEYQNIREAISSVLLPDDVLPRQLDSQISWLVSSLNQVKDDLANMQDELRSTQLASESYEKDILEAQKEIDHLKLSLAEEIRARNSINDEHEKLKNEHQGITEKFSTISSEKDGLVKVLQEISGSTLDTESNVDANIVRDRCMVKMREAMRFSDVEVEQVEAVQRLLYLSFQELKLSEMILEEEMIDRSEMSRLSSEVARLSDEAVALKSEKDSVQKELDRVEEKFAMVREKLSMAVKKGKGLVQERETLKTSLDEKTSSIEKLKQELQLRDSEIVENQERMKSLTAYQEQIQKLETDIAVISDQRNKNEQRLQNSDRRLQELIDSVERIVLPIEANFDEPWDKVNWLSEHANNLVVEKDNLVQDLNKLKEEASMTSSKLNDALETIRSLEDELSNAKQHIYFVSEEISGTKLHKESMEQEVEIMKEEILQQARKLKDALSNIKSLEDALSDAEKNIAVLSVEKDQAEAKGKQDVSELNTKLAGCMEELALARGSLENFSFDINDQLGHLQLILNDSSLLSVMSKVLGKTTDGFRNMDLLIQNLHDRLSSKTDPLPKVSSFEGIKDLMSKIDESTASTSIYSDDVPSLNRISEGLQARDKFLCDIFEHYSRYLDVYISSALQSLQTTSGELTTVLELDESRKVDLNALHAKNQAQEAKLVSLQEDLKQISSATISATQELLFEIEESGDAFEKTTSDSGLIIPKDASSVAGEERNSTSSDKIAESLVLAVRRIKMNYQKHAECEKALLISKTEIESRLKQAESAIQAQKVDQERNLTLYRDLEALKQTCTEMKYKIQNYEAKEDMLRAKEEQLNSAQNVLTAFGMGNDQAHIDILIDKANQLKVPFSELQGWSEEVNVSSPVEKLLYVVDNILELQGQMEILSNEKEDMQLSLAAYAREIEHLKEAKKTHESNYEELQSKAAELLEVTLGLEKILQRLEGYDSGHDKKSRTAKMLLAAVDKATTALSLESENSRSKIQELLAKIQSKDKIIDEWCMKVKMLEDSIHTRTAQQEIIQERAVFETDPTTVGPNTSEIGDKGSVSKNVSSSSTSAHARTVWKSPNDHLALDIDPQSKEADGKGHVIKPLNATGLIPKQGKLIADRIDGIWVSGDRLLKNQPGARLGLIAYWIILHLWLIGTVL